MHLFNRTISSSHYPHTTQNIGPSSRIVGARHHDGHIEEGNIFYLLRALSSGVEMASASLQVRIKVFVVVSADTSHVPACRLRAFVAVSLFRLAIA